MTMTTDTLTTIDVARRTVTLNVDDNVYEWSGFGGRVYRNHAGGTSSRPVMERWPSIN